MAFSKIVFNGATLMDVTDDTVTNSRLLSGYKATKNDGTQVQGTLDLTNEVMTLDLGSNATYDAENQVIVFS